MPHPSRKAALVVLSTLALACGSKGASRSSEPPPRADAESAAAVKGGLVVDFRDGTTQEQIDAWEQAWGVDLTYNSVESARTGIAVAVGVDDVADVLAHVRGNDAVEAAEPLRVYQASFVPNDPDYRRQWNLELIRMPEAWELSRGRGVTVAVLDTGVAYEDHDGFTRVPDLTGVRFTEGYDFVNDDAHANDDHGHGTHVAGTIAQATNNGVGVAGIAFEATLMPIKVLDHFGRGTSADIAEAVRFAADHGARVINLSLGGGARSQVLAAAVAYAREKGATVVAAAGNGGGAVDFPAAYPGVVAVGAVGPDGRRAGYSAYGAELDLVAPGGDARAGEQGGILQNTLDPRDPTRSAYRALTGTSMAAPHVAAVAALLYAAGARGPDEVERALAQGARAVDGQARSLEYGAGLLDAAGALQALGAPPARGDVAWAPLAWAAGLLAVALLTLGKRARPGFLNVLVRPSFFVPLLLATVGLFFLAPLAGWAPGAARDVVQALALPLPDWQRFIFGPGKLASPLFYSALIPLVLAFVAVPGKPLRPMVGGLALGFAGFLGYAAWSGAPGIAWLPFRFLALPWLGVNVLVCLFVARAMLRKEGA